MPGSRKESCRCSTNDRLMPDVDPFKYSGRVSLVIDRAGGPVHDEGKG